MAVRVVPLVFVILAVAAAVPLLRLLARTMLYPGGPIAIPGAEELAREAPAARQVAYRAADGAPLSGAFVRSGMQDAPTVLYFHGNAESAALNLPLALALSTEGIDVFLAEYRGYGNLPGRPTEAGLYSDAEGALSELPSRGVPPERLVLVGRSLGSGVALELAARHPCALLILIAPYTSVVDLGRRMVGPLAPLLVADRFDSLSKIASLTCPVVILHGTDDTVIPFEMGKRLAAAGRNVRLVSLEGAGHNDLPDLPRLLANEIHRAAPAH